MPLVEFSRVYVTPFYKNGGWSLHLSGSKGEHLLLARIPSPWAPTHRNDNLRSLCAKIASRSSNCRWWWDERRSSVALSRPSISLTRRSRGTLRRQTGFCALSSVMLGPMLPNWLFLTVLVFAATWKIRQVIRCGKCPSLFIKEVPGALQVERSQIQSSGKSAYFHRIELLHFTALSYWPTFVCRASSSIYLASWHIFFSILGHCFTWWNRKFTSNNNRVHGLTSCEGLPFGRWDSRQAGCPLTYNYKGFPHSLQAF